MIRLNVKLRTMPSPPDTFSLVKPGPEMDSVKRQLAGYADRYKLPATISVDLAKQFLGMQDAIKALHLPSSAVLESYRKAAESLMPLANFQERINGTLAVSEAMREVLRFQSSLLKVSVPTFPEVEQARRVVNALYSPAVAEALQRLADQTAHIRGYFATHARQFKGLSNFVSPELINWFLEEERASGLIESLGFVPHGELWSFILAQEVTDKAEEQFAEELAEAVWPQLKPRLALSLAGCLGDKRLADTYTQMQTAHEAGMFELVRGATAGLIERATALGRAATGSQKKTFEWLRDELGGLTPSALGNRSAYRLWHVLTQHVFAQCHTDEVADASKYPNRHASAHGIGAKSATVIDSINAILLAHFIFVAVAAVLEEREAESKRQVG